MLCRQTQALGAGESNCLAEWPREGQSEQSERMRWTQGEGGRADTSENADVFTPGALRTRYRECASAEVKVVCKVPVLRASTESHFWSVTGRHLICILMMMELIKLGCDMMKLMFEKGHGQQ